jgi:FtsP/CotA-like multicopper oxidase with cupredoxin domain
MRAIDVGSLGPLRLTRREILVGSAAAAVANIAGAQTSADAIDHTIRIAPVSLELAPGKTIETTAYNGQVPGPVLRLREGKPVNIKVINDAGYDDLVHWHGLYLPAQQDGATEEGSPIIPVGQSLIYSFTPKPTGTRWYHSRDGHDQSQRQHLFGRVRFFDRRAGERSGPL